MIELLILVVGTVVGFVTGVLVYRNNIALLEEKVVQAEAVRDAAVDVANKIEAELKELKSK